MGELGIRGVAAPLEHSAVGGFFDVGGDCVPAVLQLCGGEQERVFEPVVDRVDFQGLAVESDGPDDAAKHHAEAQFVIEAVNGLNFETHADVGDFPDG